MTKLKFVVCVLAYGILSFFNLKIILSLGDLQYVQDYFNCQIELTNTRDMFILIPIIYFISASLTINCCMYTVCYFRKRSVIRSNIRQLVILLYLTHIVMILTLMVIAGYLR
jgi:hypothetical protein